MPFCFRYFFLCMCIGACKGGRDRNEHSQSFHQCLFELLKNTAVWTVGQWSILLICEHLLLSYQTWRIFLTRSLFTHLLTSHSFQRFGTDCASSGHEQQSRGGSGQWSITVTTCRAYDIAMYWVSHSQCLSWESGLQSNASLSGYRLYTITPNISRTASAVVRGITARGSINSHCIR